MRGKAALAAACAQLVCSESNIDFIARILQAVSDTRKPA
jgi:hypothetical protein